MPFGHKPPFGIFAAFQTPLDHVPGDVEFGPAHAFHPPGNDDLRVAAGNQHGRITHRVQSRAAAAVQRDARHFHRPSGRQEGHPCNVDRFAVLVGLPHDDLFHQGGIQADPFDGGIQHPGPQILGRGVPQPAEIAPDRCPHAGDDDHRVSFHDPVFPFR